MAHRKRAAAAAPNPKSSSRIIQTDLNLHQHLLHGAAGVVKETLRSPHSAFIDINEEWSQFRLNFSQLHCDSLKNRYGIPVIKSWHRTPTMGIGVARIETDGKLFSPCEGGRPAIILPTNVLADGTLEDQLAFFPDDPERWWLRFGVAKWLNEWPLMVRQKAWISKPLFLREPVNAYNDRATVDPLNIFSNGMAMLRSCFDGAMPLTNDAWP
nr:hypothetical protein [Rhodospirillaceae bacterium]